MPRVSLRPAVFTAVKEAAHEGLTLNELVTTLGCGMSAAKRHASSLVESGELLRERMEPDGRGRPPFIYVCPEFRK